MAVASCDPMVVSKVFSRVRKASGSGRRGEDMPNTLSRELVQIVGTEGTHPAGALADQHLRAVQASYRPTVIDRVR